MTGGVGVEGVRRFYGDHFIGKWPEDIAITPVSRTVGETQVVDELVLSFTHDIEMPQLLPGVAPTGKHVLLAFCVVVGFAGGKVAHEHIYWYEASLLAQIGLLEPSQLPITGAEQAGNVLDPRARPLNDLIRSQPERLGRLRPSRRARARRGRTLRVVEQPALAHRASSLVPAGECQPPIARNSSSCQRR